MPLTKVTIWSVHMGQPDFMAILSLPISVGCGIVDGKGRERTGESQDPENAVALFICTCWSFILGNLKKRTYDSTVTTEAGTICQCPIMFIQKLSVQTSVGYTQSDSIRRTLKQLWLTVLLSSFPKRLKEDWRRIVMCMSCGIHTEGVSWGMFVLTNDDGRLPNRMVLPACNGTGNYSHGGATWKTTQDAWGGHFNLSGVWVAIITCQGFAGTT